MKLVVVESPTKAKTLKKYLDKEYEIDASNGHVRDLPKKELGVDTEKDFKPKYITPTKAKKVVTKLKKQVKEVDEVVLATDPDREGEAIAWHLKELLRGKSKIPFRRVVFHELTKEAVDEAFDHIGEINMDLVDAQQARRVLDRLVGYKLSPLLWKKVRYGLSAGRVQSVAVRLIVEKERERDAFVSEEYWSIEGEFENKNKKKVAAQLEKHKDEKIEIKSEKAAKKVVKDLSDDTFSILDIKKSEKQRKPSPPFKTSTLQQNAANAYGFTAKRTMRAAQKLFENGHITYHRTDSINLSSQYVSGARAYIKKEFGGKYIPSKGIFYKTTSKSAQEAHEAIRPTNVKFSPKTAKSKGLSDDEAKVYSLIWKRSLECQMLPAIYDQTRIDIISDKDYMFRATGSVIKFEGWLVVGESMGLKIEDSLKVLPEFKVEEKLDLIGLNPEQHFTQPPSRYSDASLIKALEEMGIGRPSTYAPTISTIQARRYVSKEGRYFVPEDVAYVVTDLLVEHFPDVIGYEFTAKMEENLDGIANGDKKWVPVVRNFFGPFEEEVEEKDKILQKTDVTKLAETDEECPECGKHLNVKLGKYGKFLSCSGFPDCHYAKPMEELRAVDENGEEITDFGECEECEDGAMILSLEDKQP